MLKMNRNLKWMVAVAAVLVVALVSGCGNANNSSRNEEKTNNTAPANKTNTNAGSGNTAEPVKEVTVTVGTVDAPPYRDVLELITPKLKEEGINLKLKFFTDVIVPNQALSSKEVDLNFFQSNGYLRSFNEANKLDVVPIAKTFTSIFGAYSKKYKTIEDLPEGATITIPSDPSNSGRSLVLLQEHGLIKLKDGVGIKATQKDIVENKKNFKILEVDQMMLPKAFQDADLIAIMATYALQADLVPARDAIIKESYDGDDFLNVLAARPDNKDNPEILKIAQAIESPEVKALIETKFSESFIWPAR